MSCRERRKLLAEVEEAVEAYRQVVTYVVRLDGVTPDDTLQRANEAYHACQLCRAALRRHDRAHGCSVAFATYARIA
ncbi:MAG TPA: hypothetical protein VKG25_21315 [Bryobacteraceae bacterium]|nr:hypothetical protein [Bryobacteraceae bacterium]